VLSGGSPRELLNAIASGDSARFQAVPGIGKRTAERVIVELRDKVAESASDEIVVKRVSDDPHTVAREALLGLGYAPPEIDRLLDSAEGDSAEDLIAEALKAAR
jgi:Holliday junction DNA helicase RuvA